MNEANEAMPSSESSHAAIASSRCSRGPESQANHSPKAKASVAICASVLPNLPLPRIHGLPSGCSSISAALKQIDFSGTIILDPGVYTEPGPLRIEGKAHRDLAIVGSAPGVVIALGCGCVGNAGKGLGASIIVTGDGGKGLLQNVSISGIRFEVAHAKWFMKDVTVDARGAGPGIWAAPLGLRTKLWIMRTRVMNCAAAPGMSLEHPDGSYIATDCVISDCASGAVVSGVGSKATFERCLFERTGKAGLRVDADARAAIPGCVFRACDPPHDTRGTGTLADVAAATTLKEGEELPPAPSASGHLFLAAGVKRVTIPPLNPPQSSVPSPKHIRRIEPEPACTPAPAPAGRPSRPEWSPTNASPIPVLAFDGGKPVFASSNPFTSEGLTPHSMYARSVKAV